MSDGGELRVDRSAKTLRALALEKMRDAILGFRFQPGERLVERSLCEQLGVSRTVVREALRHLEAEGLVRSIPNQGPIVARPDPSKAAQVYEIRALLEAEAARACALRANKKDIALLRRAIDLIEEAFAKKDPRDVLKATTDFYEILFASADKSVAWDIVQSLNARINYLRAITISTPGRNKAAIDEMRRILEAIERGDGDAAYAASIDHVNIVAKLAQGALIDAATSAAGMPAGTRGRAV
jgi:DNA-binding GntR family transcriptional regulator